MSKKRMWQKGIKVKQEKEKRKTSRWRKGEILGLLLLPSFAGRHTRTHTHTFKRVSESRDHVAREKVGFCPLPRTRINRCKILVHSFIWFLSFFFLLGYRPLYFIIVNNDDIFFSHMHCLVSALCYKVSFCLIQTRGVCGGSAVMGNIGVSTNNEQRYVHHHRFGVPNGLRRCGDDPALLIGSLG